MVRMAEQNRDWGYRRIQGALSNLGHEMARGTIAVILERHGIEPAPERGRKTTWKEFLTRPWERIVAADFFTIEAWTQYGLQLCIVVLFFMELSTRKVESGGISRTANGLWMSQIARNLTDDDEGMVRGKGYLIHDRDPLLQPSLSRCWQVGVKTVKLPPRSPNLNAYAERFVRSIKESCLERLILIGERSLRTAVQSFLAHCHSERNHQGLANRLICPEVDNLVNTGVVQRRKLLVVRKNTFGNQTGRCLLSLTTRKAENVDPSASSIPFAAGRHSCPREGWPPSAPLPSSLRQRSSPADTHDEDHPESAWRSLDIPRESDVVVFAAAPAGHLPALEVLVPSSHGALPDKVGFPLV